LKPLSKFPQDVCVEYGLTRDGKTAFTSDGTTIRLWDVETSQLRWSVKVTDKQVEHTAMSLDGTHLVTVADDDEHVAAVWRTGENRPRLLLRHKFRLDAVQFDPTGRLVATTEGINVHIFSVETGAEVCPPLISDSYWGSDGAALFDSAGRRVLLRQYRGFTVVDTSTWKLLFTVNVGGDFNPFLEIYSPNARWSGDMTKVVATESLPPYGPARIYDAVTGRLLHEIAAHSYSCWLGADDSVALSDPVDEPFEVWDVKNDQLIQTLDAHELKTVSPDGTMVLFETKSGLGRMWRLRQFDGSRR